MTSPQEVPPWLADPVPDAWQVVPSVRIVRLEGLHLLHDAGGRGLASAA